MTTAMVERGGGDMGYETKVILVAVADIIQTSKDLDEAFERVAAMANAEGVIVKKRDHKAREKKDQ
ncbi:MAG: hypothetical protein FWG14_09365 [Peptococcaceae bacterium]|nr:hypothetical protein [Peptococcaceae bacterium]